MKKNRAVILSLLFGAVIACGLIAMVYPLNDRETDGIVSDAEAVSSAEQAEEKQPPSFEEIRSMRAGETLDTTELSEELTASLFFKEDIGNEIGERIMGISYKQNNDISLDDLNYVRVLHVGFDGATHIGELIVNKAIADDILEIMKTLYDNEYPIEKMLLIDEYGGDDDLSMADNNTSSFNYRKVANSNHLSKHAFGLAIDINPLYNPYITYENGKEKISPPNSAIYADRTGDFIAKIDKDDICCKEFKAHGFTWGGDWKSVKDYQHFQKVI